MNIGEQISDEISYWGENSHFDAKKSLLALKYNTFDGIVRDLTLQFILTMFHSFIFIKS